MIDGIVASPLLRLEDQVREVRRQVEEKQAEFEVERRRADRKERKRRKSGGKWE